MFKVRLAGVATLMALGVLLIWLPQPPVVAAAVDMATLVISKGGDRTAPQSVSGPAGAVFDFFAGTSDSPPAAGATPTATCTTTAPDGTCSVDVPGRNNDGQGYWIRERTAPAGYSIPQTLDIGFGSATQPTTYNQLFTGPVANNTTRTFPEAGTGNNILTARGSAWADIRNNPALPDRCGLKIALLIDTSGSIAPFLDQVKSAANGFVDALTGTPSQIAVFRFAADASSVLPATSVPDPASADVVKAAINGLTAGGGTNWDAGLFQVAAAPLTFDAVVMLTDGNPTLYGPNAAGPGNNTRFREVENGIFSANAVKSFGTKVVAVGVGDGVTGAAENLQAISGPVRGTDFIQANYAELAAIFREVALKTCSGTISVVKKVISPSGTFEDAMPTGGWTYNVPAGNTTPTTGVTADGSGAVSFTANLAGQPSMPVTIQEVPQPGFTLEQRSGQNATCVSDGAPVSSANVGALGFTVNASRNAIVSCTVYNRAVQPQASVLVGKAWIINGTRYLYPQQPAAFQAALKLTGQVDPQWNTLYGGFVSGQSVTVDETIDENLLPPGCTVVAEGKSTSVLEAGLNVFQITNTATCVSRLKLLKRVVNPYGPPEPETSWTLSAYPPGSGTPAITGTSGVADVVVPDQKYSLGETSVPGYLQEQLAVDPIPAPATGSWHCSLRQRDGTLGPEFDGLNGGVTVALGQNAECTAVNIAQPAKLTLHKTVDNSHGGTAVNTDWVLSAIPMPRPAVLTAIVGRDGEPSVTGATAEPLSPYELSESGPAGYEPAAAVSCVLTGTTTAIPTPGGRLVPGIGQDITCTFTNRDLAPSPSPTPSDVAPTSPPLPSTGSGIKAMTLTGAGAILGGLILLLAAIRRRA